MRSPLGWTCCLSFLFAFLGNSYQVDVIGKDYFLMSTFIFLSFVSAINSHSSLESLVCDPGGA